MRHLALVGLALLAVPSEAAASTTPPSFVVIFADDLGYGDLGVFGHPTIRTPRLDRMAAEGQRWTSFYVAASVCTPSRAAILTGRLPIRSGMAGKRRVLFPDSARGLPPEEVTIAEVLKATGYRTAAIGKWHLGHRPRYLPTRQGFDSYFGIPYSNDMDRVAEEWDVEKQKHARVEDFNVPLMRDEEIVERPADQTTLTKRYNEAAIRFIEENAGHPFFLYLAHNMPHIPLFASEAFQGRSPRGLYGDVVEEIDSGVGRILETLRAKGIAENTLVVFTSDNGPWLTFGDHGGSAGLLRGGKGMTWEGGMREPTVFWWPGHLREGVVTEMGSTLDLLPTIAALAGTTVPDDRVIDGLDLTPTLLGQDPSPRESMLFYRSRELFAARLGRYKAHFVTEGAYNDGEPRAEHDPPLLFDVETDPSEQWDVAADHPDVLARIAELVQRHRAELIPGEDQMEERLPDP